MTEALASFDGFFIRGADGADELNFVKKTWLREYAESATPPVSQTYGDSFMTEHHRCIEAAIERGAVTIASRQSTPTRICGFAVTERAWDRQCDVVHFVYVRGRWRKMGVAKLLLAPLHDEAALYTHRTTMLRDVPIPESWSFNPYPFLRTE